MGDDDWQVPGRGHRVWALASLAVLCATGAGALLVGVPWILVLIPLALAGFAVGYDVRHPRNRGGWKTPPMGSWAAVGCMDATWVVDERDADRRSTPERPVRGPFSR